VRLPHNLAPQAIRDVEDAAAWFADGPGGEALARAMLAGSRPRGPWTRSLKWPELHVAMTRAKDNLHLIVPQRFFTYGQSAQGDRHVYASRTRFIPAALLPLFECSGWPVVVAAAPDRGDPRQVRLDISARMRSMWR
jgi:hypothetical protein